MLRNIFAFNLYLHIMQTKRNERCNCIVTVLLKAKREKFQSEMLREKKLEFVGEKGKNRVCEVQINVVRKITIDDSCSLCSLPTQLQSINVVVYLNNNPSVDLRELIHLLEQPFLQNNNKIIINQKILQKSNQKKHTLSYYTALLMSLISNKILMFQSSP